MAGAAVAVATEREDASAAPGLGPCEQQEQEQEQGQEQEQEQGQEPEQQRAEYLREAAMDARASLAARLEAMAMLQQCSLPSTEYAELLCHDREAMERRSRVVQWMRDTVARYRMSQDTLESAVNVYDRYLSVSPAHNLRDQPFHVLSAVVALVLSSKVHEVTHFPLGFFANQLSASTEGAAPDGTGGAARNTDLPAFEINMLSALEFDIVPQATATCFIRMLYALWDERERDDRVLERALLYCNWFITCPAYLSAVPSLSALACLKLACMHAQIPAEQHWLSRLHPGDWESSELSHCVESVDAVVRAAMTGAVGAKRSRSPTSVSDLAPPPPRSETGGVSAVAAAAATIAAPRQGTATQDVAKQEEEEEQEQEQDAEDEEAPEPHPPRRNRKMRRLNAPSAAV